MKAIALGAFVTFLTLVSFAQTTFANTLSHAVTVFGTNWTSAGVGGVKFSGSGSLTVSGVSGTVTKALLYWQGPTNSSDPNANATITFAGQSVTGQNIGFSHDGCWGFANSQAYRADVTSLVPGNGIYTIASLIKAGGNITTNGASLLVFFNDGNSSNNRDVVVYDGNDGIFASAFDGNFFGTSISGINYTSGNGALQLHVADGQNFADGALFINGLTLVPAGPIFNGVSVPGPNIANGNLWDIRTFSITSFLSPASPTLNLFSQTGSDCIALVVAVWDLPLGSAPGQTPAPTTLSVAPATGTFGGTVSLQATLRSNGVPVPGKSISFALNGTGVGSATTDASGVATLPSAPLGSINAATYTTGVGASFAGDPLFASSSGTAMLIVNKASQAITFGPLANKMFGDADFTVSATASSGLTVTFSATGNCTVSGSTIHITGAGSCTVTASQAGNENYDPAPDVPRSFAIAKAPSVTTVTCGAGPFPYTGSPYTPCSATVTGAGGLNQSLTVSYSDNINAGTVTASASYAGDANHTSSSDSKTFTIDKAGSITTVTCGVGPFTYNGGEHAPCTATVTGAGGLNQTLPVTYSNNINAGTATASASYAGDANHHGSSDTKSFTIDKAPSTTLVSCAAGPFPYTGGPYTPCSATVTGAGGLNQTLPVMYSNNINAGTATASASYAGDANHHGSSDTKSFTIDKASSTTLVSCAAGPFPYTGSPYMPCSATVTGAGGLNESLLVSYGDNVNAGTVTASASYAGDANHHGSSDTKSFTIDKAGSTTLVTCPPSVIYNGAAHTPCTATVTGAGGLNESSTVTYTDNTFAGTATASASYAGDANHTGSSHSTTFVIDKATPQITWPNPAGITYPTALGDDQLNATANVPGSWVYSPAAGTVLNAGNGQLLSVSFTPTDTANYNTAAATAFIDVAKGDQTITFAPLAPRAFGDAPVTLNASASSGLPVSFSVLFGSGAIVSGKLELNGPGIITVRASQAGDGNWNPAPDVLREQVVIHANAGSNSGVLEGTLFVLDGNASVGDGLTYVWEQISGPEPFIGPFTGVQPLVTAPQLAGGFGTQVATFQLTVSLEGATSAAFVNVTISNVNHAPDAQTDGDKTVGEGSTVVLNAQPSFDPDGDPISFSWSQVSGPVVALTGATTATPSFTAPLLAGGISGTETLQFDVTVSDTEFSKTARVTVVVEQVNHAPVANAGTPQTVRALKAVTLDGSASQDPDTDALSYQWTQVSGPPVTLTGALTATPTFTSPAVAAATPLVFEVKVSDGQLSNAAQVTTTVVNNLPVCTAARAEPNLLWPPNHRLVPITIVGVTDPENSAITVVVTGVSQDEKVNGLGDGDTSPDAIIVNGQVVLRAERSGNGNGRVYGVRFSADDGEGGTCNGTVKVSVPHSMKPGATAIDDGQLHDSTQP